ncbi:MAG TPA: GNAT family N-acetyltransferase [Tepidisphaeraceae bacterium]|nr:GNAT family N-acetyltransferase [Tepidisphaeraceae bacterium]
MDRPRDEVKRIDETGVSGLTLRPVTETDAPAVRELIFSVLAEFGLRPDPASTDADLYAIEATYAVARGRFDVLVDGEGRIIGSVALWPVDGRTVELRKMYLSAAARGRGVGRWLLDHAIARAREAGFTRMTLETARVLEGAVRLYERYGFRAYVPEHIAGRCDLAMERAI